MPGRKHDWQRILARSTLHQKLKVFVYRGNVDGRSPRAHSSRPRSAAWEPWQAAPGRQRKGTNPIPRRVPTWCVRRSRSASQRRLSLRHNERERTRKRKKMGEGKKKKERGGRKKRHVRSPRAHSLRPRPATREPWQAAPAQERNHSHLPSSPHATRAPAAARTPAGLCLSV